MTIIEISAFIENIEKKFDVQKWKIDKVHIWPIIRMDLYNSLYFGNYNVETKITFALKLKELQKIIFGLFKYIYIFLIDYQKNNKVSSNLSIIFLGDGVSKVKLNGLWYDKFCSPIIEILNKNNISSLFLELTYKCYAPRFNKSIFIQPFLDLDLIKYIYFFKKTHYYQLPNDYYSFIEYMKKKNISVPIPDKKRLTQIYDVIIGYRNYYTKILKLTNPSLGFVVGYYGPKGMAFDLACYEMKIPTIDIQHGIQGDFHPAYNSWRKIPSTGYELLPTVFLCWSDAEKRVIEKWTKKVSSRHFPLISGNMFLNNWNNDKNDFVAKYQQEITKYKRKRNILVSFSSVEEHNKKLLEELVPIMKKSSKDLLWWMRMHPVTLDFINYVKKYIKTNCVENFEVDNATNFPLYSLLKNMDLNITFSSSTVLDAEVFNVPSIIVGKEDAALFLTQIESGIARVASDGEDIENCIQYFFKKRKIKRNLQIDSEQEKIALDTLLSKINKNK